MDEPRSAAASSGAFGLNYGSLRKARGGADIHIDPTTMPLFTHRDELNGIVSAVDGQLEGIGEAETHNIDLIATIGAESLFVVISDLGAPQRGPADVTARLVDPSGHTRDDLVVRGPEGQLIYAVAEPAPGKWTLELRSGPSSRAEIKGDVKQRDAAQKTRWLGPYLRCKTCKVLLKASAWALFAYCAPFVGGALGLSAAIAQAGIVASGLLDAIAKTLGVARAVLEGALGTMKEYSDDPIDRFLGRCCAVARLCEA